MVAGLFSSRTYLDNSRYELSDYIGVGISKAANALEIVVLKEADVVVASLVSVVRNAATEAKIFIVGEESFEYAPVRKLKLSLAVSAAFFELSDVYLIRHFLSPTTLLFER